MPNTSSLSANASPVSPPLSGKSGYGLRLKISLLLTFVILGMGGSFLYFTETITTRLMHDKLHEKSVSISLNLSRSVIQPILTDDFLTLRTLLQEVKKVEPEIVYAVVYNRDGNIIAQEPEPRLSLDLQEVNPIPAGERYSYHSIRMYGKPVTDYATPIIDGVLGQVHIGMTDRAITKAISQIRQLLFLTIMGGLLVAVLTGYAFSFLFTRPLRELVRATDEIGSGNLEYTITSSSSDEIQVLSAAFNDMTKKLKLHLKKEKEVAAALEESEKRFRTIFEESAIGITVSDTDGHVLQTNQAFQKMIGHSFAELSTKTFADITYPDDIKAHRVVYHEMLDGVRDHAHFQKRYLHADGKIVWGQTTLSVIRDDANIPQFVIGMVEDISIRKQLEEERIKSNKLESVGVLAGGIAHDFNNLLTAILGNIILAEHMTREDAKLQKLLAAAEKASLRARDLTQQLLTFSRGGKPVRKKVRIEKLIHETISFTLTGSNVRCSTLLPDTLYQVFADEGQIVQVLQNIIKNADQAMPNGGTLEIKGENITVDQSASLSIASGQYVKISFSDQGGGIAADKIEKIFDPYFTTKEKGSGLGLAISYSIVSNHRGLISVQSEPGEGTTFFLYLPACDNLQPDETMDDDSRNNAVSSFSGRILVMDDEPMIQGIARAILETLGFTVDCAEDGVKTLECYEKAKAEGNGYRAVLMDLTIPGGLGGRETIRKLLQFDPEAVAIVSSGYADDPIMAEYGSYGFKGVVAKPYSPEQIYRTLKNILSS